MTTKLTNLFQNTRPTLTNLGIDYLVAADKSAHEKAQAERFDKIQDENKLRDGALTNDQVSRIVNVPSSILTAQEKRKKQQEKDSAFMNILLAQLADIERTMIDKYGEDFAEQFAADLLDEETFAKLMEIEDPEERRHAIAMAILEGIETGTIDPEDAYKNPDFKEWLDKNGEIRDHRQQLDHSLSAVSNSEKPEQAHDSNDRPDLESGLNNVFG